MVAVVPLTMPVMLLPNDLANWAGSHRAPIEARLEPLALGLMYFPDTRSISAEPALPAAWFQNLSSGLIQSDLPIFSSTNEPWPSIPIVPVQPWVPRLRFSAMFCPELCTEPLTWTDETTLRSAVARRAISSALSPSSAPAWALAEAVLPGVAEVDDDAGLPEEEHAEAAPKLAALARVAAAARRPALRENRTVLLLGMRQASDQIGPSMY